MDSDLVECPTFFHLLPVEEDDELILIPVVMFYDPTDPYAVSILFLKDSVIWTFGRELMERGLKGEAGIGDVRIYPPRGGRYSPSALTLQLDSPSGGIRMIMDRGTIQDFLRRTYKVVPKMRESSFMDMDRELAQLFGDS